MLRTQQKNWPDTPTKLASSTGNCPLNPTQINSLKCWLTMAFTNLPRQLSGGSIFSIGPSCDFLSHDSLLAICTCAGACSGVSGRMVGCPTRDTTPTASGCPASAAGRPRQNQSIQSVRSYIPCVAGVLRYHCSTQPPSVRV